MSIFIDHSEFHRMRESDVLYIKNKYPLVEQKLVRDQLKEIIKSKGYLVPNKSGCFFCCFQTKKGWIDLRNKHDDLWKKSLALEKTAHLTHR